MTTTEPTRHLLEREPEQVKRIVDRYESLHDEEAGGDVHARTENYADLVDHYYDLVTDFYEFGWGQSFHFAPRRHGESHLESLARHERFLARKLDLRPGMKVLDVGCGVGGPMREIARYSGATITGITLNAYQVERGRRHNRKAGLEGQCSFILGDFMKIPVPDASFDAIYAIEATCHSPNKKLLFEELLRVLVPGGQFAGYEWCLTPKYDADSAEHRRIKKLIEEGDALPDIAYTHEVDDALTQAGFELLEARDVAPDADPETPWFRALTGKDMSLKALPRTPVGRKLTNIATRVMERVKLAPEGTTRVSGFLNRAADALVEGGERDIFTPMYYFRARKPA